MGRIGGASAALVCAPLAAHEAATADRGAEESGRIALFATTVVAFLREIFSEELQNQLKILCSSQRLCGYAVNAVAVPSVATTVASALRNSVA